MTRCRFRLRPAAVLLGAVGCLALPPVLALATETEVSFVDYTGHEGSFDLDLQVPNGQAGSSSFTWGVQSNTYWDEDGFFQVRTMLGAVQNNVGPRLFIDVAAMNGSHQSTHPDDSAELRWVHEVPSLAYDSYHNKWLAVWAAAPKRLPDENDPLGTSDFLLGWIGGVAFDNASGVGFPHPDEATFPAKEDRMMCTEECDDRLYGDTNGWATNTPQLFRCPQAPPAYQSTCTNGATAYREYLLFTEPGIIADATGTVWMAISAFHDVGSPTAHDYRADVLLFKTSDTGGTWTYVSKLLDYTDADFFDGDSDPTAGYSFFTAPSIHVDNGSIWLDVSPADIDYSDPDMPASYMGMYEFKITSLSLGTIERLGSSGCPPKSYLNWAASGPHSGAGGYYPPTDTHQMGKVTLGTGSWPFPEDIFRVWELGT